MLDIIRSEFYKIRKAKLTLITALCLMGIAGINIAVLVYARFSDGLIHEIISSTKAVDLYAEFTRGSLYLIFVAMFAGGMIANEYTNRTIRQVVSRGTSRTKIAAGQYIALATSMTCMTLIPAALATVVGTICFEFGEISFERFLLVVLGQIIIIWGYVAFSMLIAHLTRSGGLSIGINVIFLLAGAMASSVLQLLTGKEEFYTYWIMTMQSAATDYAIKVGEQLKFIGILYLFGVVCFEFVMMRFKVKDVD